MSVRVQITAGMQGRQRQCALHNNVLCAISHPLPPSAVLPSPRSPPPTITCHQPGPGDYSIEETAFWSERVYTHVFRLLNEYSVVRY